METNMELVVMLSANRPNIAVLKGHRETVDKTT